MTVVGGDTRVEKDASVYEGSARNEVPLVVKVLKTEGRQPSIVARPRFVRIGSLFQLPRRSLLVTAMRMRS